MNYHYIFVIDETMPMPLTFLTAICNKALQRAKMKAPVKTGNLRRSIKYQIKGHNVVLYIDTSMYDTPYYEYVDTAPKKDGAPRRGNGFWQEVIVEFGNVFYANIDAEYRRQIKEEQDRKSQEIRAEQANAERKKRKQRNEQLALLLGALAFEDILKILEGKNAS